MISRAGIFVLLLFGALSLGPGGLGVHAQNKIKGHSPNTCCRDENYKPKSDAELSVMSPSQLLAERVAISPNPFRSMREETDYEDSVNKYIRKAAVKSVLVLTDRIKNYNTKTVSDCEQYVFSTVVRLANDIDRFDFRLRSAVEGRDLINSLEQVLNRIETGGTAGPLHGGSDTGLQPAAVITLKELKGINDADRSVGDTLRFYYKVRLSDNVLQEFTNFLISRDPTYPSWSAFKQTKDYSRIRNGNPRQVYVFVLPKPFYKAYLTFKRSKASRKDRFGNTNGSQR